MLRARCSQPLDAVPSEILTEILLLIKCAGQSNKSRSLFPQMYQCTTTIRLVCHRWNQIVLAEPRFWSEIVIDVQSNRLTRPPSISLVELCLRRSADVPITIDVRFFLPDGEEEELYQYCLDLFSMLELHLARWTSLTLNAYLLDLTKILPSSLNAATQLYKFEVAVVADEAGQRTMDLVSLISTTPSLRRLHYQVDFLHFGTLPPNPYSLLPKPTTVQSLVHVELCIPFTLHSMLRILRECQSAIHIALKSQPLQWESDPHSKEPPLGHFQLPRLQSLVVDVTDPSEYQFLDFLHCPSLILLNLTSFNALWSPVPKDLKHLYTFLNNAPESLQIVIAYADGLMRDEALKFFSLNRIYDLRIFEIAPLGPLPQEIEEDLRVNVRNERKEKELKVAAVGRYIMGQEPRVAIGWVDIEMHQQWRGTLDDLKVVLVME